MIELIIATLVLTVIMTPLMRAFIIAADTAARSRDYGVVNVAIENAMEVVRGANVDSFDTYMTNLGAGVSASNVYVYDSGSWTNSSGMSKARPTYAEGVNFGSGVDPWAGEYGNLGYQFFHIDGFYIGDHDAIMEVMISPSSGSGGVSLADIAAFTNMDVTFLQALADGPDAQFKASNPTGTNVKRRIEITFKKYSVSKVTCDVDYKYYIGTTLSDTQPVFSSTIDVGADGVCSAQLLYQPLYGTYGTSTVTEEIVVYNEENLDVNLFLIKQEVKSGEQLTGGTASAGSESTYRCSVALYESHGSSSFSSATSTTAAVHEDANLELYSNMTTNVSTGEVISSFDSKFSFYNKDNGTYAEISLADKLTRVTEYMDGYKIDAVLYSKDSDTGSYKDVAFETTIKLN